MYLLVLLGLVLARLAPTGDLFSPVHVLWWRLALVAALVVLLLLGSHLAARRLRALARTGLETRLFLRRHHRAMRLYGFAGLAGYAALLYCGRWADVVRDFLPPAAWQLQTVRDLLVLAPFLAILAAVWRGSFIVALAVRQALAERGLEQPLPPWPTYFVYQMRQYLLVLLLPFLTILACGDLARLLTAADRAQDLAMNVALLVLFAFSPLVLRLIWETEPFPPGPLRDRLDAATRRLGVKVRQILLWRTHGLMMNAAATGLGRPLRYVFLSDALVDSLHPAQTEAVYGHELGHVRYRHIPFFILMFVAFVAVLPLLDFLCNAAGLSAEFAGIWVDWPFLILYWGLFFGYVSRRFERQSDLVGATLPACPGEHDPLACPVHQPGRVADPNEICPFRAWAMNSALERIGLLSGTPLSARSWRHFGLGRRIIFVNSLVGRPAEVRRYHRRLCLFKWAFLAATFLLLALDGWLKLYRAISSM